MGWMYYTLRQKDVFVSGIVLLPLDNYLVAVWWDSNEMAWVRDDIMYFQPPKEKH